ncbi:MAG: hypothetical protein WDK96_00530 [Candidatus Paceibacterota bacterium]|jgi:hypothetical protein
MNIADIGLADKKLEEFFIDSVLPQGINEGGKPKFPRAEKFISNKSKQDILTLAGLFYGQWGYKIKKGSIDSIFYIHQEEQKISCILINPYAGGNMIEISSS